MNHETGKPEKNGEEATNSELSSLLRERIELDKREHKPFSVLAIYEKVAHIAIINGEEPMVYNQVQLQDAKTILTELKRAYEDEPIQISRIPLIEKVGLEGWYAFSDGYIPDTNWLKKTERLKETAMLFFRTPKQWTIPKEQEEY